ncbi:MAG: general stress protein CsbD [Bacteroidetes bacterium]|nr:general stress protein CsbD [Bacteroidota bacterium]
MINLSVEGNWNETKGRLKQKFALITDSNVLLAESKQNEILGRLQVKLGKTKEEIQKLISSL